MKQYLEVGKLNNTHGVKGELKMLLWCDGIDYIKQFKILYLDSNGIYLNDAGQAHIMELIHDGLCRFY